jgi:hypothetical protein
MVRPPCAVFGRGREESFEASEHAFACEMFFSECAAAASEALAFARVVAQSQDGFGE